jgi:hypothetical protein
MTGGGNKTFWTEDTIAGAILGCAGCFFVQAQLQTLAARLSSPVLGVAVHWWPALLIVAGVGLLFGRKSGGDSPKERASRDAGGGK